MASFSVVSNISAANAQANLNTTNLGLQKTLTRLSSGFRINMAGDDAAGLAVANSYRSTVSVLNQGMRNANDYMEMTQLALQAGFTDEAKNAIEKGFASGTLGTGPEADRQKRLRDLTMRKVEEARAQAATKEAEAQAAKEGNDLVNVGFNLALSGKGAQGVKLIEQGIAKGGLRRPEDAELRLGQAMVLARNPKSTAVLRGVTGNDGAADLARLWILLSRRKG